MRNLYRVLGLLVFLVLLQIEARAQRQTYTAEDGTQIDVEIISVDPDKGRNTSIFIGVFGPEGAHTLGANYYKPGKFFINGLVGRSGGHVDGSIFFITSTKEIKMKQSVKVSGNTKYVIKVPGLKRRSFGLHMGANMVDYSKMNDATAQHSAVGVFGGLSLLKARHTNWKIYDSFRQAQGTLINRLNADVIYYVHTEYPEAYMTTETGTEPARKIGARIYYDGKATFWSRQGRISLNYMLGVGLNSDMDGIPLFGGLGLGYNF